MKKFFSGKRLTIILAAVLTIGVIIAVRSCTDREVPDITLTYIGENYFSSDEFYAARQELEDGIDDINGDGKKIAEIVTISFNSNLTQSQEQNNYIRLTMSIGGGESRIYLMDKAYCQRYSDSGFLADISDYAGNSSDVLTNESGAVYAIGVSGNELLSRLGLDDSNDVYISLRAMTEVDSATFDNIEEIDAGARKTLQYIIKNNINN